MNLTFSAVLCPAGLRAESQFYLSKAVALSVSDTVDSFGIESRIKWPNDIYVGDGKVAGILIENDLMGACVSRSIAGIGLNVNQTAFDRPCPIRLRWPCRRARRSTGPRSSSVSMVF